MTDQRNRLAGAFAAMLIIVASSAVWAQDMQAAVQRMRERFPALLELLDAGKVGETWEGTVEAVQPRFAEDRRVAQIVGDENSDRAIVYAKLAAETNVRPELVAQRNAMRKFDKARDDHWLRLRDGIWRQKVEYDRIQRYKQAGRLGESWTGYVDAVRGEYLNDANLRNLIERENNRRRQAYQAIARTDRNLDVETVARRQGAQNLAQVRPGHYFKTRDGEWIRQKRQSD